MNEAQGLPSNLDEASRVVALEKTVSNLNSNMDKIASLLTQVVKGQPSNDPATQPPIGINPVSASRNLQQSVFAPPPIPQVNPAAQLSEPVFLNPPGGKTPMPLPSPPPVQEMETRTSRLELLGSQPDSSPQASPPSVSPETVPNPDDVPEKYFRQFKTPDEVITEELDKYKQPVAVTLGPAGSTGPDSHENRYELTEMVSPGEIVAVAEEPTPTPEDVVETKRLSRQQMLTEQVTNWLKSKDLHKFWRQFLAGACNKNLSYNTWPPEFQGPFNEKFKAMVADPSFVAALCGRITKMQMGHLVAPHVAGAFVVVTAGFLSFALLEQ